MDTLLSKGLKYPGRHRVLSRQDAADMRWRQQSQDWSGTSERFLCSDPFVISAIGLPSAAIPERNGKIAVEIPTRCRKCGNCLKHRRRLWTARAIDELKASNRTWFGTLTYHPEARFHRELQAATSASTAGHGEWRDLDADTKFQYMVRTCNQDVTTWFKRVRRSSGVPLRYLLVSEAHADGFPHFHLLVHEQALPVTKRMLEEKWRFGFSHWRLVNSYEQKTAYYVCKYLSKDHRTRIRASIRYGRAQLVERLTERLQEVTRLAGENQPVYAVP